MRYSSSITMLVSYLPIGHFMLNYHKSLWFLCVFCIALYSRWHIQRNRLHLCDLDGSQIEVVRQVDLLKNQRVLHRFCGIPCAKSWPDVPPNSHWQVRDSLTAEPLTADLACFVENKIPGVGSGAARFHIFRDWTSALKHVRQYNGQRIANPLTDARQSRN